MQKIFYKDNQQKVFQIGASPNRTRSNKMIKIKGKMKRVPAVVK